MIKDFMFKYRMRAVQLGASLAVGVACLWLILAQLAPDFWQEVFVELHGLHPMSFVLAAICTCVSFLALGRYDATAHRHFRTGISARHASLSGTAAIALAQTLGMGILTGAVARWRMLPGISMGMALRLSAFICASFMAALLVVTAVACLVLPAPAFTFWPALAVVLLLPVAVAAAFLHPTLTIGRLSMKVPSLSAFGSILFWTALDTLAAATALYLLIPGDVIAFTTLLPLFMLALGAALVTGTPGGVGPFELVLFGSLPDASSVQLLSGIIAFRAVYYAAPALIGMIAMMRPLAKAVSTGHATMMIPKNAVRAEVGVIRQNGGYLLQGDQTDCAVWPTGQALCALFDPLNRPTRQFLETVKTEARRKNLIPMLYKCSARTALLARSNAWFISHIADEAVLQPLSFNTEPAPFRTLRRKLRAAQKGGIIITQSSTLPLAKMAQIDAAWQQTNGRARGGTMGVFCADYLAHQQVFLAYHGNTLIAFASFHTSTHEWCLDLMRQQPDTPDGTMHCLIHHAIMCAAHRAIPRLSLAATPACPHPSSRWMVKLAQYVVQQSGGAGLRQFKSNFRPRWQPLYAAAPNRALLAISLADITRAVHRPDAPLIAAQPHHDDENYEVASRLAS
ncbi:phosphatidylglycerol lysyltransferase domain-containing protein [Roseobacter sp. GAI101]|uniref:phosphatidylglycerol lysyltransferase domain-containing protein n=1 Tax=Roseobacter sp. (strain GAI101) TaxID=391589 RepID=UPI0001871499|nr:phosphatidylglycerol lysyltransferase domain-containing protein [Roseobacter sp. GAI101]EEB83746.1 conserved hypothetical protein [Roseobacter sp. GAI101]